jgi:glycosyltransferase involved in cell wall biosynthesis
MIAILHGYLLEGSGSNLWTRCVVESLCMQGVDVQLICQEPHPDRYDCIGEYQRHETDGSVVTVFERQTPYPGKCVMHKPVLGQTLPVFVWDRYEEFSDVVPMVNMDDAALESYVVRNATVVANIVRTYGITGLHANHAALMAVVAQRVHHETGVAFTVMPHGSELEYAIKKDPRFQRMAESALGDARRVFVHGDEMRSRVRAMLPGADLESRFATLPLGVHTAQFEPVPRERRREKIGRLLVSLSSMPRGRRPEQLAQMLTDAAGATSVAALRTVLSSVSYDTKAPDVDLEDKLQLVDWEHDAVLLYVGRLISAKGLQTGLAALPLLLAEDRGIRLIVVGHGPMREVMELFLWALEHGDRATVERIVDSGRELEGDPDGHGGGQYLGKVRCFFRDLEERGELDRYFALAREHVRADRVIFTGYLTHNELQDIFPCSDAGLFPSIVKEAGPLVFLEALASGCFPMGTYFGGLAASIDAIADELPAHLVNAMKLDPRDTVADVVRNVATALRFGIRYKDVLSRTAQERYDWRSVGRKLWRELSPAGT